MNLNALNARNLLAGPGPLHFAVPWFRAVQAQ